MSMVLRTFFARLAVVLSVLSLDSTVKAGTTTQGDELIICSQFHIDSLIVARYAVTTVKSVVINTANDSRDLTFQVQYPETAFVSNFTIVLNDTTYHGIAKEKAQTKIEMHKQNNIDWETISLVDDIKTSYGTVHDNKKSGTHHKQQNEQNVFISRAMQIFKVQIKAAANSQASFSLQYEELIVRRLSKFQQIFKLNPGRIVEDFRVRVRVIDEQGIAVTGASDYVQVNQMSANEVEYSYAPTVQEQNDQTYGLARDMMIEYDVNHPEDGSAGLINVNDCYFTQFFSPSGLERVSVDIVFVIDTSGSMGGRKIDQTREALETIINQLQSTDRFTMVMFETEVNIWQSTLVFNEKHTKDSAVVFAKSIASGGGTNFSGGLQDSIQILKEHAYERHIQMLVMLTDGKPEGAGITDVDEIVKQAKAGREGSKMSINCLGLGDDVDFALLQRLAIENKGFSRRIYVDKDTAEQLENFFEEISLPVLKNVTVTYGARNAIESLTQVSFPSYFNGSELVVAGKFSDNECIKNPGRVIPVEVSGTGSSSKTRTFVGNITASSNTTINGKKPSTEHLFAYLSIQQYLDQRKIAGSDSDIRSFETKALELSLQNNFITELTIFGLLSNSTIVNGTAKQLAKNCTPSAVTVNETYVALKDICQRWETMALLLGIEKSIVGRIRGDCFDDTDCKFRKTIQAWYYGRADASWDEIVLMLKNMGEKGLSKKVKKKFQCFKEETGAYHKQKRKAIKKESKNKTRKQSREKIIGLEKESFQNEFSKLVNDLGRQLERMPPELAKFKTSMNLPASFQNPNKTFLPEDIINVLAEANTVIEIYSYLNLRLRLWNFLQYDIFRFIILNYGDGSLKDRMHWYNFHFSEFKKDLTLSQFIENLPKMPPASHPKNVSKHTVQLDDSADNIKFDKIEQYALEMAKILRLPLYNWKLTNVSTADNDDGSVLVTWEVSLSAAEEISQNMNDTVSDIIASNVDLDVQVLNMKVGDSEVVNKTKSSNLTMQQCRRKSLKEMYKMKPNLKNFLPYNQKRNSTVHHEQNATINESATITRDINIEPFVILIDILSFILCAIMFFRAVGNNSPQLQVTICIIGTVLVVRLVASLFGIKIAATGTQLLFGALIAALSLKERPRIAIGGIFVASTLTVFIFQGFQTRPTLDVVIIFVTTFEVIVERISELPHDDKLWKALLAKLLPKIATINILSGIEAILGKEQMLGAAQALWISISIGAVGLMILSSVGLIEGENRRIQRENCYLISVIILGAALAAVTGGSIVLQKKSEIQQVVELFSIFKQVILLLVLLVTMIVLLETIKENYLTDMTVAAVLLGAGSLIFLVVQNNMNQEKAIGILAAILTDPTIVALCLYICLVISRVI